MINQESLGTVSRIKQGEHIFYSFTMPSEILARTCFVINRDEDPDLGFQRTLDKKRAKEIAQYIDSGLGTIPNSIVLSAQPDANFQHVIRSKTVSFNDIPNAFLIIDGQHRVYGFKLAKTSLRVPVIVYEGLSKRDESRLFIDINSKQKGVPTELLLDIKKLAEYESDQEEFLRELFDIFSQEKGSVLYKKLSASRRVKGKITRSVFNTAMKPLIKIFGSKTPEEIYQIYNAYLYAMNEELFIPHNLVEQLFNTTVFKALAGFFPTLTVKVKDRFGPEYTIDNYLEFTSTLSPRIKNNKIANPSNAYKPLVKHFEEALQMELYYKWLEK